MARKGTLAVGGAGRTFGEVRKCGMGVERLREDREGRGENTRTEGEGKDPSKSADDKHWRRRRGHTRRLHVPRATTMGSAACAAPGPKGSTPPCPRNMELGGRAPAWGLHDVLGAPYGGCLEQRAPLHGLARCTRRLVLRQPNIERLWFSRSSLVRAYKHLMLPWRKAFEFFQPVRLPLLFSVRFMGLACEMWSKLGLPNTPHPPCMPESGPCGPLVTTAGAGPRTHPRARASKWSTGGGSQIGIGDHPPKPSQAPATRTPNPLLRHFQPHSDFLARPSASNHVRTSA